MTNSSKQPLVLCGITGGIAAYKTVDAVSRLHKANCDVHVVMTPAAQRFVAPLSFQAVLGRPVGTDFFCTPQADLPSDIYPHLYPAGQADAFIVMPATANLISKLVTGQADDLVCASALGLRDDCLRIFCPAMNTNMWNQPVVQQNARILRERGWLQIGPESGPLACGTAGDGRMTEPTHITERVLAHIRTAPAADTQDLHDRRVLILSGPTHEHLDPVRFIGNLSSGKAGRALAYEAARRGATVHFVTGPVPPENLPLHSEKLSIYHVTGAEEMLHTAKRLFKQSDMVIFAAAVADYMPAQASPFKRKKGEQALNLHLKPTPDIAATLCRNKRESQTIIGFALQDENPRQNARRKLEQKKFDLIILNSLSAMGAEQAEFECLKAGEADFENWGLLTKAECAKRIFNTAIAQPH